MAKMGGEGDGDYRIPYIGADNCVHCIDMVMKEKRSDAFNGLINKEHSTGP